MPSAVVIVNAASGGHQGREAEAPGPLLADAGIRARCLSGPIRSQIRASLRAREDIVVVDGGDGTISATIAAHAGRGRAIGILPAGTMNLLASDNAIPLERQAAAAVIAGGETRPVHAGVLGGRLFLHSAFTGLPARLGIHREQHRGRLHALTMARLGVHAVLTRHRDPSLTLFAEHGEALDSATFVIGVGRFAGQMLPAPMRVDVESETLTALGVQPNDALDLARLLVRGALGTLEDDSAVDTLAIQTGRLTGPRRHVHAMLDGESVLLRLPATVAVRPHVVDLLCPAP